MRNYQNVMSTTDKTSILNNSGFLGLIRNRALACRLTGLNVSTNFFEITPNEENPVTANSVDPYLTVQETHSAAARQNLIKEYQSFHPLCKRAGE